MKNTTQSIRRAATEGMARAYVDSQSLRYQRYDEVCARWYVTVAPMNDIALSSLKDAVEQLKASEKWKKKGIRLGCSQAMKLGEKYEDCVFSKVSHATAGDARQYFMDFMDKWQAATAKDVMIFRFSISNALLRLHYPGDTELASWVYAAYNLLLISVRCYDAYFMAVRKAYGEDWSKAFYEGRLEKVVDAFRKVADSFTMGGEYPIRKDEMCKRAVKVLLNRFTLGDVSQQAADEAIVLNPDINDRADEVHREVEAEQEQFHQELLRRAGL